MNDTIPNVPHRVTAAQWLTAIRWGAAIVFVVFGAGKFVNHGSELASFRQYALPAPAVWVHSIGVLEIAGGLLLASGRLVRPAALALAGDMVGAIVVSGIGRGEGISLTLAPALLVGMIFLARAGGGRPLDRRLPWARPAGRKRSVA
jgi:uncharacterized membrane protein YphA (DoxX/SURF4 family)